MVSRERLVRDTKEKHIIEFGKCSNIGYGWRIVNENDKSTLYTVDWSDGVGSQWYKVLDVTGWTTDQVVDYVIKYGAKHVPESFYNFTFP